MTNYINNLYRNLRILPGDSLNHYIDKRYNNLPWVRRFGLDHVRIKADYGLIHSWKPGFIKLSQYQAAELRRMIDFGEEKESELGYIPAEWCFKGEEDIVIEELIKRVYIPELYDILSDPYLEVRQENKKLKKLCNILEAAAADFPLFPAIQNRYEMIQFLTMVKERRPKTVVEIGTAGGGMFYCLAQLAHPEALLVSIDIPEGLYGGGQDEQEIKLYESFKQSEQKICFIRDRSFHHSSKQDLLRVWDGRKIDLLFIDGDHSYGGVSSDFQMYSSLVSKGGMIAFHDINLTPKLWGRGFDVGIFWNDIKEKYINYTEIVDPDADKAPILFQNQLLSYGFGILTEWEAE